MDELTALALAARDGDRVALAAFVRRAQPDVWRLVAHLAGRDLAEDLAQETFLRALRALPAYRGDAAARTWLLSIARRTAVDAIRGAERRRRLLSRLRPAPDAPEAGQSAAVEQLLSLLHPDRRAAFVLTQLLGLTYAEAAVVCGCEIGTIRSRVARARHHLIEVMGAEAAEG
ncbi:MAG: sigma-70 family RNA polymerase sigma factor [Actinomycetota bacterium]|nr:sigma-70 family RNA polymerase sigma factor [Actinomycetota bacterium]